MPPSDRRRRLLNRPHEGGSVHQRQVVFHPSDAGRGPGRVLRILSLVPRVHLPRLNESVHHRRVLLLGGRVGRDGARLRIEDDEIGIGGVLAQSD
jgi:hypothetical protein